MQRTGLGKTRGAGGEEKKKERKKKKEKLCSGGEQKASQEIGTVRGAVRSPGVGSFNKKFLAPTAVSAGKFTGNVYRPTEEFRQGQGRRKKKSTNHKRAHCYSPRFQSARLKKQTNKKAFPNCSAPSNFLQKKKGGKKSTHKNTTHKTWGVIAAPNFSPRKSPDSLLFLGSGNCLNAI